MKSQQQITQEITSYVARCGGPYSSWYIGIAADPCHRLFVDHCVEKTGSWIFRQCASSKDARGVEEYFLNRGMRGGPGGGDHDTVSVYAYEVTGGTRE